MRKIFYLSLLLFFRTLVAQAPPTWSVNPALYQHSVSVIAKVVYNGQSIPEGTAVIAAFAGAEVRGTAMPIVYGSTKYFFLTVYTNVNSEQITFKAYIGKIDSVLSLNETFQIAPNGVYGSIANPFNLHAFHMDAPELILADSVTTSSFYLGWQPSALTQSYQLDISTSPDFAEGSFLSGYENAVIFEEEKHVSGLLANTAYYCRIRSVGAYGVSHHSATVSVLTAAESYTISVNGAGQVSVPIPGSNGIEAIELQQVVHPGNLLLYYFTDKPANHNLTGIVTNYRWVVSPDNSLVISQSEGYRIKLTATECPGIAELAEGDSTTYRLYKRHTTGSGAFIDAGALKYHRNGTDGNQSDDYLLSSVIYSGFSEFVLEQTANASLQVTAFIEGLYNGSIMQSDTISLELHQVNSPYDLITSQRSILNSTGNASVSIPQIPDEHDFYIVIRHRNSIETWSSLPQRFIGRVLQYDFSLDSSMAYEENLRKKGDKWCIMSGDVNQDGFVDFSDLVLVDNASTIFATGYERTDLTGDNFTDYSDLQVADNAAAQYSMVISPILARKRVVPNPRINKQ